MDDRNETRAHYKDNAKHGVRGGFHARYANKSWFSCVDEHLRLDPGARVLDVGCGPGVFWQTCQNLPDDITLTLLDRSAHMVRLAAGRLGHLRLGGSVVADAVALPFPDACFDAVTAMHMLYHVPEPTRALAEIHRVLRPGGRCIVTTNGPGNLPQIADLSRAAFGSAIDDMVQARFGTPRAMDLMQAQFGDIQQHGHRDVFKVDEADAVIDVLRSMPPGDAADAAGLARLRQETDALMAAHHGCVPMPIEQDVIIGVRAG